jgi:LmbE family N-acetylglucosaminyl deacetylase
VVTPLGEPAWAALVNQAFVIDEPVIDGLSPLLVLAPHPDDETLGCGGLIARAAQRGYRPRVAFLTDGDRSHVGSPTWPIDRLAETRRAEAKAALAILGVPEEDIVFLGWPDGDPCPPGGIDYEATMARLQTWTAPFRPWSVWAPWRREKHCDHAAAAAFAADFVRRQDRVVSLMEYIVWGWGDPDLAHDHGAAYIWGLACGDLIALRKEALAQHRTQAGLITDAVEGFEIPPELAAVVERPFEIFLEVRP